MGKTSRASLLLGGIGFVALTGVVFFCIRPEPNISGPPAATPAAQPDALPSLSATKAQPSRQEQENAFMQQLYQLPLAQRSVLLLHFVEEFPLEDIATITGTRLGTVKSRLHYAKKALRKLMEQTV